MNIYWKIKKKKGYISALAPMEGVTDTVFRQVLCDIGRPDLFFTEFLNVEGFCSKGKEKVIHRLDFTRKERPIIVQLWGNTVEDYVETLKYVKKLKPDGIDINIGCSVRDVLSGGRCSALIKEKPLVKEIIEAVQGASGGLPVSVKTRLGYDEVDVEGWIGFLLTLDLDLITVHGRISKEGYSTPARWDMIAECVKLRDQISPETLIIGNGDIKSLKQGEEYVKRYGVDGFMVARGIMNNPWLFSGRRLEEISTREKVDILIKHLRLFDKTWEGEKPFNSQKKYIKAYITGFDGANELRKELMETSTTEEVVKILDNFC
ncbi:MAG TPA: tRNA-dihydrouridine synthase [Candidatus Dojkabacteria bacterium]|nr:tRNA-dihydrouridine synthase [Candidatus Dojkabacteria bacterium]